MEDLSNYEKLREDAQKFYSGISSIFSPALDEKVLRKKSEKPYR